MIKKNKVNLNTLIQKYQFKNVKKGINFLSKANTILLLNAMKRLKKEILMTPLHIIT